MGRATPYQVTPLDGIKERVGTVTDSEGADRIALKDVATGEYVTAGTGAGSALKESATSADAITQFDAFDWGQGVRLVDETKVRGDAVGAKKGDWVKFAGAALDARTFTARTAARAAGTVEVRLGSPTGPLAGTAHVAPTGGVYSYATTTAALHGAKGHHDVYLVFGGGLRLSTFSLG